MKRGKLSVCLVTLGIAAAGCSGGLDGTYSRPCDRNTDLSSDRESWSFSGERATRIREDFATGDCAPPVTATDTAEYLFKEGDGSQVVEGAVNLDVTRLSSGEVTYTIYKFDGDNLYFGKDSAGADGSTPEQRHRELDTTEIYRKQ